MLIDGIQLLEGSKIQNAVIANGPAFPVGPTHPADLGELFFKTDNVDGLGDIGLYVYDGSAWTHLIDSSALSLATGNATTILSGTPFFTDHSPLNNEAYFLTGAATIGLVTYQPGLYIYSLVNELWELVPSYLSSADAALITSGTFDIARIPDFSWTKITSGKPTTLSGYGITDAASSSDLSTHAGNAALHLTSTENTWLDAITATSAEVNYLSGTTSNVHTDLAGKLPLAGGSVSGTIIVLSGAKITLNDAPTLGTDAVNKTYVDANLAGLTWKNSVKAATVSSFGLSGLVSTDGVTILEGDRVLVKDQATTSQNGIYIAHSGAWTRSTDMDSTTPVNELNSAAVFVEQGTVNASTGWTQIDNVVTLGTDPIAFTQFNGAAGTTAGVGLSKTGNTLSVLLGAGVSQLPTSEVGVDIYPSGGLILTTDGTASSTLTNAQLSLGKVGTAGTYKSVTTDAYGRVTAGTNPTTLSGYGITDAQGLNANLSSVSSLSTGSTGLVKLTSGVASLDSSVYLTANQAITLTGDVTGTGNGSFAATLATVTQSTGSSFAKITLDTKGRVTGNTAVAQADITGLLGSGSISNTMLANSAVANLGGTNSGDETLSTLHTKLGVTTLSGSNTGDQTITLTGGVTGTGTGSFVATVVTNANLTGDVTSVGNATTLGNAPVIAKVLTAFTSGAGVISTTDSILTAFEKADGNIALKAPIASPVFTGPVTLVTGSSALAPLKFVSGSQTSVAVAGTMEYDGTGYYLTLGSGARHTIAFSDSIPSSMAWTSLTGVPTTLSGFGITDSVQSNTAITGATHTKITYDAKGLVTGGVDLAASDIPALSWGKITSGTPTTLSGYGISDAAPLAGYNTHIADYALHLTSTQNTWIDAITASAAEVNYSAGVTSAIQTQLGTKLALAGGSMTGNLTIPTGVKLILADAPSVATDAVNKAYVDANLAGLTWKNSVRVATTANLTSLAGTPTIDGIALVANDRILVKDQTTASQNGIYIVSAGSWARSADMNITTPINEFNSAAVYVDLGTANVNTGWTQINTVTTIGTDPVAFTQFTGASGTIAGVGLSKSGNTLSVLLGAGVSQLPTSEVGVDVYSTGGLFLTIDGTASNSTTNAQLSLTKVGTAGTYKSVTTDAYGRITAGTNPTSLSGYGITDAQGLNSVLTSITGQSAGTGLVKLTSGVASLDSSVYLTANQAITLTGDITGTGNGSFATTLATVSQAATGNFVKVTLDTKGRVTGNTAVAQADITALLGSGSISNAMLVNTAITNLSGTNSGDETTATIKTKLGITTLSGSNTGDQTITLTGGVTGTGTGSFAATVVTNANLTGDVTSIGNASTVVKINGTTLSALSTGLLKNTTSTGVPSIAAQADVTALLGTGSITNTMLAGAPATAATVNTIALRDANGSITCVNDIRGYATTATATGTTTLTVASAFHQFFTGTLAQTVALPVTSTLILGQQYQIVNNSTLSVTVQSSGLNTISTLAAGTSCIVTCILASGTTAASWSSAVTGGAGGVTIADDVATNATYYPTISTVTTGSASTLKTSSTLLQFNPSTGTLTATNFNSSSDISLKENIVNIDNSAEVLKLLRPVSFDWKKNGTRSYGVIAQELELILPELVNTKEDGIKSVDYTALIGFLIASNKELLARVEALEKA